MSQARLVAGLLGPYKVAQMRLPAFQVGESNRRPRNEQPFYCVHRATCIKPNPKSILVNCLTEIWTEAMRGDGGGRKEETCGEGEGREDPWK